MLTGIHILLSYKCSLECDHCFLYSSPWAKGTMTIDMVKSLLCDAKKIETMEWIYFEGGEPMLFYPTLIEGIRIAKDLGFKVGVVTNAYGAVSLNDAKLMLQPFAELSIDYLSISDDSFHYGKDESPAKFALEAAKNLEISTSPIEIEEPFIDSDTKKDNDKGSPVIGGGAMFRGRAVEKLVKDLPLRPAGKLITCPYENLLSPSRVHVDSYGNVHICQGLLMGNMLKRPLSVLEKEYDPESHAICGALIKGGPDYLAKKYHLKIGDEFVDECHYCYLLRKNLIDKFPEYLSPLQVYGL